MGEELRDSSLLGQILIQAGYLTSEQLDEGLKTQKEKGGLIGQCLIDLGHCTEEQIVEALAIQCGYRYLPLSGYIIPLDIVKLIPEEFARKKLVIAVDRIKGLTTVAMADPLDSETIEQLKTITRSMVLPYTSLVSHISGAIDKFYHLLNGIKHAKNS